MRDADIPGPDAAGQAIDGAVRLGCELLELAVAERLYAQDGSENLFLHDLHVTTRVPEDRRLDEVPLALEGLAATHQVGVGSLS